jgi:cell division protein FtsZ
VEVKAPIEEPFMKSELKNDEPVLPVASTVVVPENKIEDAPVEKQAPIEFAWNISNESMDTPSAVEPKNDGIIVHHLELDNEEKISLDNVASRAILSPEEQQRKTQERMSRIHDLTVKLKKSEGIAEFENEPAYVRRNIQLDNSKPSTEQPFSRFGLSEEENKGVLRSNNFLHDNVD